MRKDHVLEHIGLVTAELFEAMAIVTRAKARKADAALNKKAGRSPKGAARRVTQGEREEKPRHADVPSPERHRPVLAVVSSRQRPTAREKRVSPCLVLVVDNG